MPPIPSLNSLKPPRLSERARSALQRWLIKGWAQRGLRCWLLMPFSLLFGILAALRRSLYRTGIFSSGRVPIPVLVVGNVLVGGSGKTPIVIALVRHLQSRGLKLGVISRGHGRRSSDCREVIQDSAIADVGDEPALIHRVTAVPVFVAPHRIDAARALLARYPQMTLYLHERGVPHLVDPSKLINSATRIYGEQMDVLWGEFLAVPAERIVSLNGGEPLHIGDQHFTVIAAPGHAIHHLIYIHAATRVAFVGDMAGIRMPGYRYVRPATPPPDIDLEAWDETLQTLRHHHPAAMCLTHYGAVFDSEPHLQALQAANWRWAELVRSWMVACIDVAEQLRLLTAQATADMGAEATELGISAYQKGASITMSLQGLTRYWSKRLPPTP